MIGGLEMDKNELIVFRLDLLERYLRNYETEFFRDAVNHTAFADDLASAKKLIEYLLAKTERITDPMKPVIRHGTHFCGNCDHHVASIGLNYKDKYCSQCGTPVDWSDFDERTGV